MFTHAHQSEEDTLVSFIRDPSNNLPYHKRNHFDPRNERTSIGESVRASLEGLQELIRIHSQIKLKIAMVLHSAQG